MNEYNILYNMLISKTWNYVYTYECFEMFMVVLNDTGATLF